MVLPQSLGTPLVEKDKGVQAAMKTSLENKHLGNDVYFMIITSSSHPLFLQSTLQMDW